jgi:hypothetical protein
VKIAVYTIALNEAAHAEVELKGEVGRYVRISLSGKAKLHLDEIEVY